MNDILERVELSEAEIRAPFKGRYDYRDRADSLMKYLTERMKPDEKLNPDTVIWLHGEIQNHIRWFLLDYLTVTNPKNQKETDGGDLGPDAETLARSKERER